MWADQNDRTFQTQSAWIAMKVLTAAVFKLVFCWVNSSTTFLKARIHILWDAAQVTAKSSICNNNKRNLKNNKLLRASEWGKVAGDNYHAKLHCKFLFWRLIRRSQHSIYQTAWVMGALCVQTKEVLCLQGKHFPYRSQQSAERVVQWQP